MARGRLAGFVADLTCVRLAARGRCTPLLRCDGPGGAYGHLAEHAEGQARELVAAVASRTALLRSDGLVEARGRPGESVEGQANVRAAAAGRYQPCP